jgi:hypothetical protein
MLVGINVHGLHRRLIVAARGPDAQRFSNEAVSVRLIRETGIAHYEQNFTAGEQAGCRPLS